MFFSDLIKEVEKTNVSADVEANISYKMTPPSEVKKRKKQSSGSAEVVYNLNVAVCEFLAVARSTAT